LCPIDSHPLFSIGKRSMFVQANALLHIFTTSYRDDDDFFDQLKNKKEGGNHLHFSLWHSRPTSIPSWKSEILQTVKDAHSFDTWNENRVEMMK
jgi:hypothetical protein